MRALLMTVSMLTASLAAGGQGDRPATDTGLGRSPVLARHGMIATSQPLASAAGLRVLMEGGNAVDAGIAAAAVLNVVEPMMCGIGGDLFALYWEAETETLHALNATGRAGARADAAKLRADGRTRMPGRGPHAVTVPGALDGWDELVTRFGTRPLADLLQPAIRHAEEGFPVSEIISVQWKGAEDHLRRHPAAAEAWLVDGERAPEHGEVFRAPELGATFRKIAAQGPDVFYDSAWVEPISTTYRGVEVFQVPPNSQGFVALEMLNILEGYDDLAALGHNSAAYLHRLIEAKKLAFADRDAYLGDPETMRVPVETLISKDYAAERRALLSLERAAREIAPGMTDDGDTIYLTVVDEDRNALSLIYSIFGSFGSGLVVPETGIVLQNRGTGFSLEEGHPNELAPGKLALHTNMPGMAFRDGKPWVTYGVMGGDMQPQGHTQVLLNLVDFGMHIQKAGEMARFRHSGAGVGIESGVDADTRAALTRMGHTVMTRFGAYGGYQAIMIDWERPHGWLRRPEGRRRDGLLISIERRAALNPSARESCRLSPSLSLHVLDVVELAGNASDTTPDAVHVHADADS